MRKFLVAAEAASALTAAALGLPAIAAADDSADVVVRNLETQGYNVQYLPSVPSVSKKALRQFISEPGVRMVTVTGAPLTLISTGSSTARVSGRVTARSALRWRARRRAVT